MKEGFYGIWFQGPAGQGAGIIVLDTNTVVGIDVGGVEYDGEYSYNSRSDMLDLNVKATVPPGVWLVQGVPPQQRPYSFDIIASVPRDLGREHAVTVETPFGPISLIMKKVRNFPKS
jgi:hypothetical protein